MTQLQFLSKKFFVIVLDHLFMRRAWGEGHVREERLRNQE
jgi:hypothetical protein